MNRLREKIIKAIKAKGGRLGNVPLNQHLSGVKDGQANDFILAQTDDYPFVSNVAIISRLGLVKVNVKHIVGCIIIKFGFFYEVYLRHITFLLNNLPDFEVTSQTIFDIKKLYHKYITKVNTIYSIAIGWVVANRVISALKMSSFAIELPGLNMAELK